jgi:hypothetical protein
LIPHKQNEAKQMSQTANVESVNVPPGLEPLVAMASVSDRRKIIKHYETCEAEGERGHADKWKRLAATLARLSPKALTTIGSLSLKFYRADGKYRKQVFALEDLRTGKITVYAANVMKSALSKHLISRPQAAGSFDYGVPGTDEVIEVEPLETTNADPPLYKDMLGWNRTAMRITIPATATEMQLRATEQLCELAAKD